MVGLEIEAAFPDGFRVPDGVGIEVLERVEEPESFALLWPPSSRFADFSPARGEIGQSRNVGARSGRSDWLQAMRGNDDQAADAGFCGAQDEHDHGEGGARQEEQTAADAHAGEREQRQDDGPDLVAVAADGEGVVQCEGPSISGGHIVEVVWIVWMK